MTNEIEILDPCTSDEWRKFITSHPDAGVFHHPAWMSMLRDVYGYRMFAVCVMNGNSIAAGMPFADVKSSILGKRWVSLPFSDHCQPLVAPGNAQALETIMRFLKSEQAGIVPKIEIRWDVDSVQGLFHEELFVTHILHLNRDPGVVRRRFEKQSLLRSLARAEREGVVVREAKTREELGAFFDLQVMTRKRLGVPAQPKLFFDSVWEYIIAHGLGYLLLAYKDDQPIGGGVYFQFGKNVYYKYGASDLAFRQFRPNQAYMWEAIRRSCVDGFEVFDFGRSDIENDGLRRFKREWGTTELPLRYTFIANAQPKSGPSKLNDLVGAVIRNSPEIVCRLSGQLLYKHFA